ncbi:MULTISPECIES: DUF302 domain-containing protein [unclassified Sulfitobacter]|uniref:DUF302 domain-containing protein n=1 Tax=unclassified Sulfitobacter TaxID=196795 RepID=UPI0007C27866|nr:MULTISPECIES: DUF302 domain-containing protein [unclassified Sulfitobacter]KZY03378.1 camphor resistance protein CrcB [Sulfitobacter sp. HI0023]KZY24340.1 camphor resistance protein CrcB [Sulfitobacter sp. HI0040]KZZ67423.1 camphor resistance protein CrcB [Sulfitobacter sp. HI0129]
MLRTLSAAVLGATLAFPAMAADLVHKMSPHSVPDTIDRLESAVEDAGATVFARVDHAEGAMKADMELRPTQLLIFGNPELGTPAMKDKQTAGLDLPMRVLAYADDKGQVHVVYHQPETLAEMHGLPEDAEYLEKMAGALDKLTSKAIAEGS